MLKQIYFILQAIRYWYFFASSSRVLKRSKRKLAVIGNANVQDLDGLNLQQYDVLFMNYGPQKFKVRPDFHLFELPHSKEDQQVYIDRNLSYIAKNSSIFRPNSLFEMRMICSLDSFIVLPELRLNPALNIHLVQFIVKICMKLGVVPFYRSSISFAVFLGNLCGYECIELFNFDPYNYSGKHNGSHGTIWLDELRAQGVVRFSKSDSCLF